MVKRRRELLPWVADLQLDEAVDAGEEDGGEIERRQGSGPAFSTTGHQAAALLLTLGLFSHANGRVYAIPARGNDDPNVAANPAGPYLIGWPAPVAVLRDNLLPWIEGVPGSPALADVDGDGRLEVGISSVVGPAYLLKADGTSFFGTEAFAGLSRLPASPARMCEQGAAC